MKLIKSPPPGMFLVPDGCEVKQGDIVFCPYNHELEEACGLIGEHNHDSYEVYRCA